VVIAQVRLAERSAKPRCARVAQVIVALEVVQIIGRPAV